MNEMADRGESYTVKGSSGSGINIYTGTPPDRIQGAVTVEYGALGKNLAILTEAVEALRIKLEPVIGIGARPVAGEGQKEAAVSLSPLAESLRSENERVRRLTAELQDITARIEL